MKEIKTKVALSITIYVVASIILQIILMYFVEKNAQIEIIAIHSAIIAALTVFLYLGWYYLYIEKYRMVGIVVLCIILGLPLSAWFWIYVVSDIRTESSDSGFYIIVNCIFYACVYFSAKHKAKLYKNN